MHLFLSPSSLNQYRTRHIPLDPVDKLVCYFSADGDSSSTTGSSQAEEGGGADGDEYAEGVEQLGRGAVFGHFSGYAAGPEGQAMRDQDEEEMEEMEKSLPVRMALSGNNCFVLRNHLHQIMKMNNLVKN